MSSKVMAPIILILPDKKISRKLNEKLQSYKDMAVSRFELSDDLTLLPGI